MICLTHTHIHHRSQVIAGRSKAPGRSHSLVPLPTNRENIFLDSCAIFGVTEEEEEEETRQIYKHHTQDSVPEPPQDESLASQVSC